MPAIRSRAPAERQLERQRGQTFAAPLLGDPVDNVLQREETQLVVVVVGEDHTNALVRLARHLQRPFGNVVGLLVLHAGTLLLIAASSARVTNLAEHC